MSGGGIFSACAVTGETQRQGFSQRQCFRRHVYRFRQIHEGIVCFVKILLPFFFCHPITELDAAKAESVLKHFWRNLARPVCFPRSFLVDDVSFKGHRIKTAPFFLKLRSMFVDIFVAVHIVGQRRNSHITVHGGSLFYANVFACLVRLAVIAVNVIYHAPKFCFFAFFFVRFFIGSLDNGGKIFQTFRFAFAVGCGSETHRP